MREVITKNGKIDNRKSKHDKYNITFLRANYNINNILKINKSKT
jgi:hypothetical protein